MHHHKSFEVGQKISEHRQRFAIRTYDKPFEQREDKMADAALARALGTLKIEKKETHPAQAEHHTLSFSYPDFSIPVPLNEVVETTPPAKVGHRSRPPTDPRDLALYDTDFALALPLKEHHPSSTQYSSEYMRLVAAVEALKANAGTTTMGVLRLHHEIWDENVFRVRLETHWVGPFPKMPPQDFELSGAEWEALVAYTPQRPWVAVLQHLVDRESAKACYHVRQRIWARCGREEAEREEASWADQWGTKRAIYAAELLQCRLHFNHDNLAAGRMPELMLECGHGFRMTCREASNINGNMVLKEFCDVCQVRIFKQEDEEYLDAVVAKTDVWQFAKMQRVWASLVQDVHQPNSPRRFHAMSIFRILGAALDSLRPPEWVAPSLICPSRFEETSLVLEHLESMFWDSDDFYELTAEQLLDQLEKEALGVRDESGHSPLSEKINPPGWDDFVARWLRRTAYFLAYRRCDRVNRECKGLHGHRDGLWYSPEEWEEREGAMLEKEESACPTDELTEALKAIAL